MNCVLPLDSNAREPMSGSRMTIEGYSRCIWRLEKGRCHANGCLKARGFRGLDVRTYLLTCRHATGIYAWQEYQRWWVSRSTGLYEQYL